VGICQPGSLVRLEFPIPKRPAIFYYTGIGVAVYPVHRPLGPSRLECYHLPMTPSSSASTYSEYLFGLILENLTEYAIFMLDKHGQILSWNPGVEHILGYTEKEFLGRDVAMIFTPEDIQAGADRAELQTAESSGRAEDKRWHLRKDGSRFWANGLVVSLLSPAGALRGFAKILRDDTSAHLQEVGDSQTPAGAAGLLTEQVEETAAKMVRAPSRASLLRQYVDGVTRLFGVQFAGVWLKEPHQDWLLLKAHVGLDPRETETFKAVLDASGDSQLFQVWQTNKAFCGELPADAEWMQANGVTYACLLPLAFRREFPGAVGLLFPAPPPPAAVSLLTLFTSLFAAYLSK
jgi:PAS domain S-box-containing protein